MLLYSNFISQTPSPTIDVVLVTIMCCLGFKKQESWAYLKNTLSLQHFDEGIEDLLLREMYMSSTGYCTVACFLPLPPPPSLVGHTSVLLFSSALRLLHSHLKITSLFPVWFDFALLRR